MALKLHLLTLNVCQTDCEFFSPNENATPARVRCSRDRQARKKNEKVVKKCQVNHFSM